MVPRLAGAVNVHQLSGAVPAPALLPPPIVDPETALPDAAHVMAPVGVMVTPHVVVRT